MYVLPSTTSVVLLYINIWYQIAGIKESDIQITERHVQELLDGILSSQNTDALDIYDALDRLQLNISLHRFLGQDEVTDVAAYEKFRRAKHILGLAGTLHLFLGWVINNIELFFKLTVSVI